MNRPAVEYGSYKPWEDGVKGTNGVGWKRSCQKKERWFGPKKIQNKISYRSNESNDQALSITFLLNGAALHSQFIYSAFNIAK